MVQSSPHAAFPARTTELLRRSDRDLVKSAELARQVSVRELAHCAARVADLRWIAFFWI
jgi:hypothetical protein